jgi:hypothetical protein
MGNRKTIRRVAVRCRFSACLFFGCGFDLYEGLCWGKFLFFKYNGLFDGQCSVQENAAENTISFIQKLIEMKPLHAPPDPRPARPDLHLACHSSIDSASIILRKIRRPGTGAVNVQKEARHRDSYTRAMATAPKKRSQITFLMFAPLSRYMSLPAA